jgi:hypothetical protein
VPVRAAVAALVVLLGVAGCAAGRAAEPAPVPPTGSAVEPAPTSAETASEAATALERLLLRREAALRAGDSEAFATTVDRPTSSAGVRQLAAFRSARSLGLSRLAHDSVPPVEDPAGGVVVTLRYRVDGVDRADRSTRVRYRLARAGPGWLVAAEEPAGGDPAAPWLAMPGMRVERGEHAVVAGTAADAALAEAVATVDRVLPALAVDWTLAPERTLVLLPRTEEQARALLGRSGTTVGDVAATTEGPLDAAGRATGDRVVVDAAARERLTATGREVVLAHELTHVAVRATLSGTAPAWLSEGYADHVGYARAELPVAELAAPLVRAVRAGRAPTELPRAADLDPSVGDIEVPYLAAWQAVELVAARAGEAGVRRLLRACTVPGDEREVEATCDRAMPRVVGEDRAALTRDWRRRLAALGA